MVAPARGRCRRAPQRHSTAPNGLTADIPIELIAENARPQCGLVVRDETLEPDEVTLVRGLPVTTVCRTAFDFGRHLRRREAVARLDALMRAAPFSIDEVDMLASQSQRARAGYDS